VRDGISLAILAIVLGQTSFLSGDDSNAHLPLSPEALQGEWLSDGYGEVFRFDREFLHIFQLTTHSCIAAETAIRNRNSSNSAEAVFVSGSDVMRLRAGTSPETRWFHFDGSVSNILIQRASSAPEPCQRSLADTAVTNYQAFWDTFAEQYPFFELHNVDWIAVDKKFRPQVTNTTTLENLFKIFRDMLQPLHDAHTGIDAESIHQEFHGYRPAMDRMQRKNAGRIAQIIESRYVKGGLRDFCHRKLQYGLLIDSVGYLRINSFEGFSADEAFASQADELETALDEIFKNSTKLTVLIIDVRINPGGSDAFGISIASRLAGSEYLAYSKVTRNDIHDPKHHTAPQPVVVHVSLQPGFWGPVVLLTSSDSVSAAETFSMALLGRQPHVTSVGQNTQGVFSDVLDRKLPNGWIVSLPNEVYISKNGQTFDGTGVPPDVEVPVFSSEDLANNRDTAIEKALELLKHSHAD
jgi:hypothetical protein